MFLHQYTTLYRCTTEISDLGKQKSDKKIDKKTISYFVLPTDEPTGALNYEAV